MTDTDNESGEFLPLPFFPWDKRPSTIPIEVEEAATALYLSQGLVHRAAERLRCEPLKLQRLINRSPRLTRLHKELASILNDKVHEEYINAFAADDDRRREWAASKVANTKQFQDHPLAPNAQSNTVALPGPNAQRIVISWETGPIDGGQEIQHGSAPMIEGGDARSGSSDSSSE